MPSVIIGLGAMARGLHLRSMSHALYPPADQAQSGCHSPDRTQGNRAHRGHASFGGLVGPYTLLEESSGILDAVAGKMKTQL